MIVVFLMKQCLPTQPYTYITQSKKVMDDMNTPKGIVRNTHHTPDFYYQTT